MSALQRLARARRYWRLGRHFRYPLCCVLRFCLDALARADPRSGTRRGAIGRGTVTDSRMWVPCGWWHPLAPVCFECGERTAFSPVWQAQRCGRMFGRVHAPVETTR